MALEQTNSVAFSQNIDLASTFASPPPSVGSAGDDAGDILGSIAPGGVTDDRQPTFQGQGTPGDTIVIRDNGNEIGTTEVDENGTWTFTPSTDLLEGQHAITVVARDSSGNESAPSPAFNFEIDVTPPDASRLNVSGFTDNVGGVTGNVISGGITDETRPLLSGISTGVPGHTVTVMVKDAAGTHELGPAIIGENGQWTFQVDTPLNAGLNTFMLMERDAAGNETMPTGRYKVTVSTDKPNAPVIDSVFDDVGEPHMLRPGEATNDARPTLAGTAPANHTVKFYDGSTYLGKAVADESGHWRFTPQIDLPDGAYNITATATSALGQTSDASSAWNFVVDTTPPTQIGTVTDIGKDSGFDADDYLTNDGSAGRLLQGKLSATLGAGETLQVSTDGGITWTTAFVAGDQWSAQDGNSHTGDWTVQTRVVDAAGNLGPVESQAMAMDTTAPAVPTKVVATDSGIEVQFNPAGVAVGHKLSLILRGDHFDYALTAADIAAGKVLVPGFKSSDAAGLSVAISDAAGNVSPYISPPFQGKETLDNLPKISVGESHTTSTGVGIEMVAGYVEPFDATHLYLSAQGIVSLKVPHPAKFVEIEYGNTHAAPYGKVEFYSEAGVLLGTRNMLSSPSSPNPMLKVGLSSEVPIAYIKVYCLDAGTAPGVNDAILLGDLMWTGGGQSSNSAQHQTLTDASAGTLHGGSDNNVFTVTDVRHLADSAISGNGGLDTLKLTGANQVLDLTALGHKVSSVEVIDITGAGNNKLSLSLADVMENGTKDLFLANGRVQMMVKGNAGDAVWLSDLLPNGTDPGDWTQGANVTIDGVVYEVYQHSGFKADLLVQQGVTVGLRISIDRVMDDAGPTTGEIDKGGLTDDATPTLYGKASANGIVKIYDGSTLLGQTVADAKGNWSYTPDTPLSEGPHSLSATVTTAGNAESAKTAVFELTVDTFTPTQTATVTEIGKDSGLSATDFLTNDGSAGRLMQGTLSAALASGETLQVSTDGGKTWKAAFVEGNKWSAQDDNSHSSDWTVQTRVVNEAGSIGTVQSQAVVLDTVAPKAPLSFKAVGTNVEVSFDKSDVVAGDRILVSQAGKSFSYALTAADVAAGKATFAPGFTAGSSASIGLIDAAGNASLSLRNTSGNKIEFSSPTGSHASWDGKDIGPISVLFDMPGYSSWYPSYEGRDFLYVYSSRVIKLGMPSGTSDFSITLKYSDGGWYTGQYITAHSANGAVLGKLPLPAKNTTEWMTFDFSTFGGEEIAYIELYTGWGGDSGFYLDKLSWNQSPNAAPSENQTLANGEAKHMIGGSGDTTFNIQNASDLDKSTVSGNEGLDTLKLTGANQTLDLTALAGKVSSVEIIDLTGTGNNTLKLSLADVMNNGAKDQFVADGRVQMMVKGNAGDKVMLSDALPNGTDTGDWVKKANVTVGGVVYEVYQHSGFDAELLVQQGVTVTLQNAGAGTFHIEPELEAYVLDHATMTWTDSDDTLIARLGFADRLEGGAGNDTFTKVGTGDTVHGGAGDDTIRINSGDFARLDGGLGIDTLVMDGTAMHIDLSALGAKVQGFEKFDLGAGGNTLALHASDVLAGGMRDMVTADGKVQMLVNGANGDVNLLGGDDSWTLGNAATVGGVTYSVYTNLAGTAELLVEDKVHVTIL